jgi:hypothetical protein
VVLGEGAAAAADGLDALYLFAVLEKVGDL